MSDQSAANESADLGELASRLRDLAGELRSPELSDEDAEKLAREAAELVSKAGNEIDRALRDASSGG